MDLKFYVWEDVLCDYYAGLVCVAAHSKKEALDILKTTHPRAWEECSQKEPLKVKKPMAFVISGGS